MFALMHQKLQINLHFPALLFLSSMFETDSLWTGVSMCEYMWVNTHLCWSEEPWCSGDTMWSCTVCYTTSVISGKLGWNQIINVGTDWHRHRYLRWHRHRYLRCSECSLLYWSISNSWIMHSCGYSLMQKLYLTTMILLVQNETTCRICLLIGPFSFKTIQEVWDLIR